jgi:hypothetical protein
MRDGAVIRPGVPGKGFYDDIGFAGIFYGPAGDNSPGITMNYPAAERQGIRFFYEKPVGR